ncbi:MAG: lycopene cyclase domain-containing protein [Flavobacteriales bacterium]
MQFLENNWFYFILLIVTIAYPLLQSFESRLKYYSKWKNVLFSALVMMFLFIPWDIWFTNQSVWAFNKNYTVGWSIYSLPIEEWLFFIIVPFACVFIYEVLNYYFRTDLKEKPYQVIALMLGLLLIVLAVIFSDRLYTMVCFSLTSVALFILAMYNPKWIGIFFRAYFVSLIPFIIINGFLTGSFNEVPIVSYNSSQIIGFRILNIPIEDSIYNLLMLLIVIAVYSQKRQFNK